MSPQAEPLRKAEHLAPFGVFTFHQRVKMPLCVGNETYAAWSRDE